MSMKYRDLAVPAVIFVLFAAFYLIYANSFGSSIMSESAWDITHYQTIAEDGYTARPCTAYDYPPGDICGNVGWFPAWPMMVKLMAHGQIPNGIIVFPYLFALYGFILFFKLFVRLSGFKEAVLGTIALGATPTAFYLITGFPYAFMLFLFASYLYLLYNREIRFAKYLLPVVAIIYSFCYPPAFLTAVIPLIYLIQSYRQKASLPNVKKILSDVAYYILPFAAGPLLLSLYFYFKFDDFLMILHFQEKYQRNWNIPFIEIYKSLSNFRWSSDFDIKSLNHTYFAANFVIIWYGLILLLFYPYRVKTELVVYSFVLYLFSPATGSVMSIWRHYILLFPVIMILATSDRPLWVKAAFVALGFLIAVCIYFPNYLNYRLI